MAYIDHIAPVRATGPIDVPSGPARLLPAWAMATWLVRQRRPVHHAADEPVRHHLQPPTPPTPKESR